MPFVFNPPPCPPKCATKPSSEYDAYITRGTTPTFSFTLPENISQTNISELNISFSQDETVLISKSLEDCEFQDEHTLISILEQEDTLALLPGKCYFQLKIKLTDDNVVASQIYKALVDKIISSEVL